MRTRLRTILRRLTANGLYYSGLLWVYAGLKLRHRVVVLMYHRILPDGADTFSEDSIIVRPGTFSRHLQFLKRHFRLLTVQQLADALRSGQPLPSRGCLVTFDDGWQDNVQHALPLLRQHDVPAVVFLATDYVGATTCFWQERLARRLFAAAGCEGPPRDLVEQLTKPGVPCLPPADRRLAIREAITAMKQWPQEEIARLERRLVEVMATAGMDAEETGDDRFMDWESVSRLVPPSPLVAAAHGCSHSPLTQLESVHVGAELAGCKQRIEAATGRPVTAIAYPNGNYDDAVVNQSRREGYVVGFTTVRGLVSAGDDPLRLRRLNVHEAATSSVPELLCIILGVFHKWPQQV